MASEHDPPLASNSGSRNQVVANAVDLKMPECAQLGFERVGDRLDNDFPAVVNFCELADFPVPIVTTFLRALVMIVAVVFDIIWFFSVLAGG